MFTIKLIHQLVITGQELNPEQTAKIVNDYYRKQKYLKKRKEKIYI